MPNRIIKESICSSDTLNELSDFEFRLWIGLLVSADDAGRGDARPAIIKGRVFPLRERVTVKDIDAALHGLAASGCVSLYKVGGKPYYWFPTWAAHQRIDRARPKYPAPEEADADGCSNLQTDVVKCNPSAATCRTSPQTAADCRLNPIQYESESNTNPEVENAPARVGTTAAAAALGIEAYAAANLDHLSPRNMEELAGFMEHLTDELVRHAIDEACANGKRTWAYVRSILLRYSRAGYKTIGEVIAAESERERQKQSYVGGKPNPALNYEQRSHQENDYSGLFVGLEAEYGGDKP